MAVSSPKAVVERLQEDLQAPPGRVVRERAFSAWLLVSTAVAVVVLVVLLVDIFLDGSARLFTDFPQLLTSYTSRFPERTGIRAGLTGTLSLMVLVAITAFPIGVGAAIYLEEFAPDNRFTRLMEANISNLAGVPSVVYGLLGSAVFVYILGFGRALISGALTLTLLILPVIIVAARESLRAVPRGIRDGGLALGATPLQVAFRQTLPAALPGIMTGTILAVSRAIGETAPILVAGAIFTRRADNEPWHLFEAFTALPIQIFSYVSYPQEAFKVDVASAAIIVLLVALLILNSAAIYVRSRFSRRM